MTSKNLINAIIEVNKAKDANKAEQDNARKKGDLILLSWLEKRHTELCEEIELKLQMATLLDQQGTNQINPIQLVEMLDGGKIPIGQIANADRPKKVFVNLKTKKK